jgi:hypothetical protein
MQKKQLQYEKLKESWQHAEQREGKDIRLCKKKFSSFGFVTHEFIYMLGRP